MYPKQMWNPITYRISYFKCAKLIINNYWYEMILFLIEKRICISFGHEETIYIILEDKWFSWLKLNFFYSVKKFIFYFKLDILYFPEAFSNFTTSFQLLLLFFIHKQKKIKVLILFLSQPHNWKVAQFHQVRKTK